MNRTRLLVVAGVLVVLGLASIFAWKAMKPDPECAPEGAPYSGFVEDGCPITDESFRDIQDFESGVQWGNLVGLVLILGGVGTAGYALIRKRGSDAAGPALT